MSWWEVVLGEVVTRVYTVVSGLVFPVSSVFFFVLFCFL